MRSPQKVRAQGVSVMSQRVLTVLGLVIAVGVALGGVTVLTGGPAMPAQAEESGPTEISDWNDLDAVRDDLDGDYVLINDLDQDTAGYDEVAGPDANNGSGFNPIGSVVRQGVIDNQFMGSFDGQGHTISDLSVQTRPENYPHQATGVGLFAASNGTIKDLMLSNISVDGSYLVGGLVGANRGIVTDLSVNGTVTGYGGVGGVIGRNFRGTVSSASASGIISGGRDLGGLIGMNDNGTVSNVEANNAVTGELYNIGGLVGENNEGSVADSSANGNVTGGSNVGGLIGGNIEFGGEQATVRNVSASGRVNGSERVGGLVGGNIGGVVGENVHQDVFIMNASASGNVNGSEDVGGLVGENDGTVSNVSASGAVNGSVRVGGLAGANNGNISHTLASGAINGSQRVGGLVGKNEGIIAYSEASGAVNGSDQSNSVGGLIGDNTGEVRDAKASGSVDGFNNVGGLIGSNDDSGNVNNSFAVGLVSGEVSVGGLIGFNMAVVSGSYFDTQTTTQPDGIGSVGPEGENNVTGLQTDEMRGGSAETNMSVLDFEEVWETVTGPADYPVLQSQPEEPTLIDLNGADTGQREEETDNKGETADSGSDNESASSGNNQDTTESGSDDTPEESGSDVSSDNGLGPGFGVGIALASLGGAAYLVNRRINCDDQSN